MNRHLTTELLSAYLDSELALAETQRVELHCDRCADCRERLIGLRRASRDVASLGSAALPAALRAQIRGRVAAAPRPMRQLWLARLRRFLEVPAHPAWRSATAALFGLVACTLVVSQVVNRGPRVGVSRAPLHRETVETILGEPPLGAVQTTTTGEVDGLKFVWTEEAGWVQKGLEGERPETSVDVASPQGRELLRRFNDLQVLLADGDSVVLRYNLETVEIRSGKSGQALPIEEAPHLGRVRAALELSGRVV